MWPILLFFLKNLLLCIIVTLSSLPGKFKYSLMNNFLSWWNYSQLRFNWTKEYSFCSWMVELSLENSNLKTYHRKPYQLRNRYLYSGIFTEKYPLSSLHCFSIGFNWENCEFRQKIAVEGFFLPGLMWKYWLC